MAVSILRWKGGSGGDMLLHMMSNTCTVLNTRYTKILDSGKTEINFSWLDFDCLTEFQKIALRPEYISQVNLETLKEEILQQQKNSELVWIKSHYYDTDVFNDITVDLVVDPLGLSFAVESNIKKTETLTLDFNKLASMITNEETKIKYSMYLVAVDMLNPEKNISDQTINVSDLLFGRDRLQPMLEKNHMTFNDKCYDQWLANNFKSLPSKRYQDYIANQNYDYMDSSLSLSERYSLMALSNSKFVIL